MARPDAGCRLSAGTDWSLKVTELTEKKCKPCEGGTDPLSGDEARHYLNELEADWDIVDDDKMITRDFKFKGFFRTMSFVNAVAWIANTEDHHPDLEVGYSHCRVRYTTHAIGGLSINDFICAAKIDKLVT